MSQRIFFQANQLSVRGTEIALYDYAHYNQRLLGNTSVIAYDTTSAVNNAAVIKKFEAAFEVHPYKNIGDINSIIKTTQADLMYRLRLGSGPQVLAQHIPTMVHEVFPVSANQFHGAACAFVSPWLSRTYSNGKIPAVSHMVDLPATRENLRHELGIPSEATVFGCHGGTDSFDIPFAKYCVKHALEQRRDLYFIFLNIAPFLQHPRAIFLPANTDLIYKTMFINACDAMLHARKRGESFGLACAEFSVRNKPVLTYALSGERNHIDILGARAILYAGPKTLLKNLLGFDRHHSATKDWDAYSANFSPEKIMRSFQQHFIDAALSTGKIHHQKYPLSLNDKAMCLLYRGKIRAIKSTRVFSRIFL